MLSRVGTKGFLISMMMMISVSSFSQKRVKMNKITFPPVVCYGENKDNMVSILPPDSILNFMLKSGKVEKKFEITYNEFPSEEAKDAFQYALNVWSAYLDTEVPIRVYATYKDLGLGTLANASATGYYYNFEGAKEDMLYAVALTEKMLRRDVNGTNEYDISVNINSGQDKWYYGIDGNTPSGKFDFVSTIMHEIGHGLGFIGTFNVNDDNEGTWGGLSKTAMIFDSRIINGSGKQLINTRNYPNPSVALRKQYTSKDLYFNSPIASGGDKDKNPKLWAPSVWDPGSSIYHLDDNKYPAGNVNSLMTHATGTGEAIHNPGPLTLKMFYEMGWKFTYIEHEPKKDIESIEQPVSFNAKIISDNPPGVKKHMLYYSYDNMNTVDSVELSSTDINNEFESTLDIPETDLTVSYYFKTNDSYDRVFKMPVSAPDSLYTFYIGKDVVKPKITHFPISYSLINEDSLEVSVNASDNLGIDSVYVEYMINGLEQEPFALSFDTLDAYNGHFLFEEGQLAINDSVLYRVVAVDSAVSGNVAYDPAEGYHLFMIESILEPLDEFQNDFSVITGEFIGAKEGKGNYNDISFFIGTPDGLDNPCLHTPNPYKSPDEDNTFFDYITQLKTPIKLRPDAAMKFDEIALVEPGELGTVYSDEEFWDYVIVEGSKDLGKTWLPVKPGWDCRRYKEWQFAYIGEMEDNNSVAVADPSLYRTHKIDMLATGNFDPGDEILLRFRLHSDPYAHGWGWAIDNLFIQGQVSSVPKAFDNVELRVYPNPNRGNFHISAQFEHNVDKLRVTLFNIFGKRVYQQEYNGIVRSFNKYITPGNISSGIYLLVIESEDDKVVRKISVQ